MKTKTLVRWSLIVVFVLVGAVVGVTLVKQNLQTPEPETIEQQTEALPMFQEFQLMFTAQDGSHLVPESRALPACEEENLCIQRLFSALAEGPVEDSLPVIPEGVQVLSVQQDAGVVIADFSADLIRLHPGGTLSELLTVYGLTNTLAVNFPHLRQLTILIDGQPVKTLKGHVSLETPVAADFAFSKPPYRGPKK